MWARIRFGHRVVQPKSLILSAQEILLPPVNNPGQLETSPILARVPDRDAE